MGGVSPPPGAILSSAEKYNGTAWTATGAMVNERRYFTGLGTETAAMACGGIRGPSPGEAPTSKTETFDGSTWTEVNDLSRNAFYVSLKPKHVWEVLEQRLQDWLWVEMNLEVN